MKSLGAVVANTGQLSQQPASVPAVSRVELIWPVRMSKNEANYMLKRKVKRQKYVKSTRGLFLKLEVLAAR